MLNRWARFGISSRLGARSQIRLKSSNPNPGSATDKEPTTSTIWFFDQVGMWPLVVITGATIGYFVYEIYFNMQSPEYDFDRKRRKTMDYLQNDKDPRLAQEWAKAAPQAGPEFIHKIMPYPRTKDYKPE